ncbi:MAG: immunity 53 family protein [Rhodocyclaceae bacterium]|nr:immunity 53 family protein [Rhodocyclaceae bacterium]
MSASALQRLQDWYASNCDGDWELTYGISIETTDAPGWCVSIDLRGTPGAGQTFTAVDERRSDSDWIRCETRKNDFVGHCSPGNLEQVLELFLGWMAGFR